MGTLILAKAMWAEGSVTLSVIYNDGNLRATSVVLENNTEKNTRAFIGKGTMELPMTASAGQTASRNIPNPANVFMVERTGVDESGYDLPNDVFGYLAGGV